MTSLCQPSRMLQPDCGDRLPPPSPRGSLPADVGKWDRDRGIIRAPYSQCVSWWVHFSGTLDNAGKRLNSGKLAFRARCGVAARDRMPMYVLRGKTKFRKLTSSPRRGSDPPDATGIHAAESSSALRT